MRRLDLVVEEAFGGAVVVAVGCIGAAAIGLVGWDRVVVGVACMRAAFGAGLGVGRLAAIYIEVAGVEGVAGMFEHMKAAYMDLLVG